MNLFLFGAGYSVRALARSPGTRQSIIAGTTRDRGRFPRLEAAGIKPFIFDGETLTDDIAEYLKSVTHMVVSAAPDERGDPVLRVASRVIAHEMPCLEWVGYLSTVGVYGDHGGEWVDEQTECRPVSKRSKWRVDAEREWKAFGQKAGLPVAILRLAGIYGPGRNAFNKLSAGTARRLIKPGQVFNRIHVADIAGAIAHLAGKRLDGIFNVTDDEPAPPQDVIAFAARLMKVEVPAGIPFAEAELTSMARSFYGENKRVSNARLKQAGFELRYPDYRGTLTAIWAEGNWQAE